MKQLLNTLIFLFCYAPLVFTQQALHFPVNFIEINPVNGVPLNRDLVLQPRIDDLNEAFAPTNFSFSINTVSSLVHNDAESFYDRIDLEIFHFFKNQSDRINVYIVDKPIDFYRNGNLLNGLGQFPISMGVEVEDFPDIITMDHNNSIIIERSAFLKNWGILQHEFGHFFGLFHTFEGLELESTNGLNCEDFDNLISAYQGSGDFVSDTPPIFKINDIKSIPHYYNFCSFNVLFCCDLIKDWKNDDEVWKNYMQYHSTARLNSFTSGQITRMTGYGNVPERLRLSSNQESIRIFSIPIEFNLEGEVQFRYEIIDPNNFKAEHLFDTKNLNGIYRLQITKNLNDIFTFDSGYHDTWNQGANAEVVVDAILTVINGSVDFTWDDSVSSSVFEGPQTGTTYKATLAKEYALDPGFSTFSDELVFTITPPASCGVPTGLSNSSVTTDRAFFGWNEVEDAQEYRLYLKKNGNLINSWPFTSAGTFFENLSANTTYCWYLETTCSNGTTSESEEICFMTKPVVQPEGINGDLEVQVNVLDSEVTEGDELNIEVTAIYSYTQPGAQQQIAPLIKLFLSTSGGKEGIIDELGTLKPRIETSSIFNSGVDTELRLTDRNVFGPAPGTFFIIAEIDYDNALHESNESNNIDADEFLMNAQAPASGCTDPNAHNYHPAASEDDGSCETCSDGIQNGNEEDVDCGGRCAPCASCEVGSNLRTSALTNTSAVLEWDEATPMSHYWIYWYEFPNGTLNEAYNTGDDLNLSLSGLSPGSTYCWYLRSSCGEILAFSEENCFTTSTDICQAPSNRFVNDIWQDQADLVWIDPSVTNPDIFQFRYRPVGTTTWTTSAPIGAGGGVYEYTRSLSGLAFCTAYEWQLQKFCDAINDWSGWSASQLFTSDCSTDIGDFRISNVSLLQDIFLPDELAEITATVTYDGQSPDFLRPDMYYYLSPTLPPGAGDFLLDEGYSLRKAFPVSEEVKFVRIPAGTAHGNYYMTLCIDGDNSFSESNENNNCTSLPIQVGIPGCTDPDAHNFDPGASVSNGICQTCSDGIKNGDEVEIDCGGSRCQPCEAECAPVNSYSRDFTNSTIDFSWDDPAGINSYAVLLRKTDEVTYTEYYTTGNNLTVTQLIPETEYCFKIRTYCQQNTAETAEECLTLGNHVDGCTYPEAHNYNPSATRSDGSCETCFDGLQNGDETGVDCGGSRCYPCDCDLESFTLDFNIYTDFGLQTQRTIIAESSVIPGVTLQLRAGEQISLLPGFHAQAGSTFSAGIEDCPEPLCIPGFVFPAPGNQLMDNGCADRSDPLELFFDWTDCPGAERYHLYAKRNTASVPIVDNENLTVSEYYSAANSYVPNNGLDGWEVRVRAQFDGVWSVWSDLQSFTFEPLDTDCPAPALPADRSSSAAGSSMLDIQTKISPNPFSSQATLSFYLPLAGAPRIVLTDINGKELKSLIQGERYNRGWHALRFSREDLPDGLYLLRIRTAYGNHTDRVLMVR